MIRRAQPDTSLCAFAGCLSLAEGPRQTCASCRRDFCLHHRTRLPGHGTFSQCTDPECESFAAERRAVRAEGLEGRMLKAALVPVIGLTALGGGMGLLLDGLHAMVPLAACGLVMGIAFAIGGAVRAAH